jgi:A/G-specific adenine glycosylase
MPVKEQINKKSIFTKKLLRWNIEKNDRSMPWKGEKNPYRIWLSEIILQQTRVEQGWDYYKKFISAFPDIKKLAKAPPDKVLKLWEGLGYYSRCKNLMATANKIAVEYNGFFPDEYNDILQLKGVGPYTAAAIASFAYNKPYAVVDGNVFRVLARFFGNNTAIDSTAGKKIFTTLAEELLDKKQPGIYNQAIMDFGAVVCKPQAPLCNSCCLKKQCAAFANNQVNQLPVKNKKATNKNRWFYYIVAAYKKEFLVRKRTGKDIWEGLYEFVLHEGSEILAVNKANDLPAIKKLTGKKNTVINWVTAPLSQKLSHQTIYAQFIKITLPQKGTFEDYEWVTEQQLLTLPFPKIITVYLKDKNVSLNLV